MQAAFNFFIFLSNLPKIVTFLALFYIAIKVIKAFFRDCILYREDNFFKSVFNFFDPYRQSIFSFKYKWFSVLILIGIIYLLCKIYIPPQYIETAKGSYAADSILNNRFFDFINYLVHENLGHNLFCTFGQNWFCWFSGSFIEILFPCIIYLFSLQIRGGLFFSPIILFWMATAFYDAGIYASDAVVSKLYLVSSDMVSDFDPGTVKGDWHYILTPLNALGQAETIGMVLEFAACVVFALALFSLVEYITNLTSESTPGMI